MHMTMKYTLPSIFSNIYANIISIRMETFIHLLLDILQNDVHCLTFMVRKIEI